MSKRRKFCAMCEMDRSGEWLCPRCERLVEDLHHDLVLHYDQVWQRIVDETEGVGAR
jgi:hypothetical protein